MLEFSHPARSSHSQNGPRLQFFPVNPNPGANQADFCRYASLVRYRDPSAKIRPARRHPSTAVVFRPGMARIAAHQLAAHLRVESGPEPRQITGDLHWLLIRGKQMEDKRHPLRA